MKNQEESRNIFQILRMIVSLLKYCFTQKIVSKTEMDYVLAALNLYYYHGIECFSIIRRLFFRKTEKRKVLRRTSFQDLEILVRKLFYKDFL